MNWKIPFAGIGVVAALGAGIYAWGLGMFWPCEALGGISLTSQCSRVLVLEGRSLNGMDRLPNGNILAGTRGAGTDPDTPLTLVEIELEAGQVVVEVPLLGGPAANASLSQIAVNGDGTRVALAALRLPTTIVDRQGNVEAVIEHAQVAFMAFDAPGHLLIEMGRNTTGIPDVDRTQVFDLGDTTDESGALIGMPPSRMFASGVQTVLSDDGKLYAQGMDALADAGMTALRVGSTDDRDAAGLLLVAQLRAGCSYTLPRLAFSPDGGKLAASFWCPSRWGAESAALLVWDVAEGRMLARIPTDKSWSEPFWLDDTALLVERYDPDRQRAELFEVRLKFGW